MTRREVRCSGAAVPRSVQGAVRCWYWAGLVPGLTQWVALNWLKPEAHAGQHSVPTAVLEQAAAQRLVASTYSG